MLAAIIALSLWFVSIFGEVFRHYLLAFTILWFFIPLVSFWLGSKTVRWLITLPQLRILRVLFVTVTIILSFSCFSDGLMIEERFCRQFIASSHISSYIETADDGTPFMATRIEVEGWLPKLFFNLFELGFLTSLAGIPYLAWLGMTRAIEEVEQDHFTQTSTGATR